jgi:hypothetical protein
VEGTDSSQRRPNAAATLTGRASRSMLARREAPGDGGGVLVQRTTAALTSQESRPTTRLTNVFAAKRATSPPMPLEPCRVTNWVTMSDSESRVARRRIEREPTGSDVQGAHVGVSSALVAREDHAPTSRTGALNLTLSAPAGHGLTGDGRLRLPFGVDVENQLAQLGLSGRVDNRPQ